MGNTPAAGCKLAVLEIFGDVLAAVSESMSLAPTQTVEWCGKCILTTLLTNPPPHLIRAILWEVYKIGWHYELCALNQALNPQLWEGYDMECLGFIQMLFHGSLVLVLWSEPLPSHAGDLRLTDSLTDNEWILCSFCLLSTWPNAHPSFGHVLLRYSGTPIHFPGHEIPSMWHPCNPAHPLSNLCHKSRLATPRITITRSSPPPFPYQGISPRLAITLA